MRSTAYLGIALGTLWIAAGALADDSAPSTDSLAQMPPNPVTTPTSADKDVAAPPTNERHHRRDKQPRQSETASTAPASGAAAPASAATGDSATQPPAQPKKICHSMDVLGSKIPKRVCATQEEWAAFNNHAREDAQDGLRRLQDQGANAPASPGVSASQLPP